tara:strand:- start:627 stop:2312 length:1686 start_codon:yes stop_codon:yes gene_type:complete
MACSKLTIVFNGEVYNYKELREDLINKGYEFETETDTEVLLKAFHCWGVGCLRKLTGMFSFCVFDEANDKITLVRDAFGMKPLFFSQSKGRFVFASEMPALLALLGEKRRPDLQAAYDYLVHGDYGSNQHTFFEGIEQLMPASYVEFDLTTATLSQPVRWWTPNIKENKTILFEDAVLKVREKFLASVKLHLRSDVPIGAALSGGIDSSAIVCAMRRIQPNTSIHTFSYIAKGKKSEEKWVDLVNDCTSAISHKVTATAEDLVADLDKLISIQGEPFGTTSIYAQYKVFELAKEKGITVTLDGQGADELLAGYIGYPGERLLSIIEDYQIRRVFQFSSQWAKVVGRNYWLGWKYLGRKILPNNLYKFARKFFSRDFEPSWLNINLLKAGGVTRSERRLKMEPANKGRRVIEQLAYSLRSRGLPTLLRHADRNSMAFSIESRVPFLTIEMADYLYSLPEEFLISNSGETKHVFRHAMEGILPKEILERQDKIGFDMDSTDWGQIYIDELKSTDTSRLQHLIDFDLVTAKNSIKNEKLYWRLLNYAKWYNLFFDGSIEENLNC